MNISKITKLVAGVLLIGFASAIQYAGVNMAGAEFGEGNLPGIYNQDYIYNMSAVPTFTALGMNLVRLPFRWERLQQSLNGPLDVVEQSRLVDAVGKIKKAGASVIIDPHNYARYRGQVISPSLDSAFANFWAKVATIFKNDFAVIFELVNEPHDIGSSGAWVASVNKAISSIRAAGANNLILVPGTRWTGGWSWSQIDGDGASNSQAMLGIHDPKNNYAFTIHQYFDGDYSGQSPICVVDYTVLNGVTNWLRANKFKGFLTEFAGGYNDQCKKTIIGLLQFLEKNNDVWSGWTWWTAGPWWGNYMYSIQPVKFSGVGGKQIDWLVPFLPGSLPDLHHFKCTGCSPLINNHFKCDVCV